MSSIRAQRSNLKGNVQNHKKLQASIATYKKLKAEIKPRGTLNASIVSRGSLSGQILKSKTLNGSVNAKGVLAGKVSGKITVDDTQMYILVMEDGTEIPAVVVSEETKFDATPDDIRLGKTAATESGVTIGEKVIPGYQTHEGAKRIRPGQKFEISLVSLDQYDYTLLQCIICKHNTNLVNSVAAEKVVLNDSVYDVLSVIPLYSVTKNHDAKTIDLGFVNDTKESLVLKYFTCKEIY